jgi:hypothetical protein
MLNCEYDRFLPSEQVTPSHATRISWEETIHFFPGNLNRVEGNESLSPRKFKSHGKKPVTSSHGIWIAWEGTTQSFPAN